jgi:hypothetical protein
MVCCLQGVRASFLPLEQPRITALTTPAPDASKEVHTMSNTNLIFTQAMSRARVADVRALAMGSDVCAATGRYAVAVKTDVQGTTVPSAGHITLDVVRMGAFPGYLAWSPPI